MKLIYDNLYDFKPFYGIDNWNRIVESGKIDAFDDYLENTYPDGISATGLDALLWNDDEMEQIFKEIGIETTQQTSQTGGNTMSTRSRIGIARNDGSIISIYCQCDGYPSHVGKMLLDYYDEENRIQDLIALGDLDVLEKRLIPDYSTGGSHNYKNRQAGVTLAGRRDFGNDDSFPVIYPNRAAYEECGHECGVEYLYLFSCGFWECYNYETEKWLPIETAIKNEDQSTTPAT